MKPGDPLPPDVHRVHTFSVTIAADVACTRADAQNALNVRLGLLGEPTDWHDFKFLCVEGLDHAY